MPRQAFPARLRSLFTRGPARFGVSAIERLLFGFSVFVVPIVIALATLTAVTIWPPEYPGGGGVSLHFRAAEFDAAAGEPALAQVRQNLESRIPVAYLDTHLSEQPFWFLFTVAPSGIGAPRPIVELPSRHALDLACWAADSAALLGRADRASVEGALRRANSGFTLDIPAGVSGPVLCRGHFSGPARLTLRQWEAAALEYAEDKFHRDAALLDGGLLILTVFVLLTALINREWIYVVFAAWLIGNLRIAALSAGFDTLWFGHHIPPDWMFLIRRTSMASYCVLTIVLFTRLFAADLKQVGFPRLIQWMQWSCLPLLLCALVLPYRQFLPVFWLLSVFSVGTIVFLMSRILIVTHSAVAVWYAISIAITVGANFNEVIAAALGVKALLGIFNSVTAALASSLMAALAIAEQLHQERIERRRAQAELHNTYEAIPIGLFTLDLKGDLLRINPAMQAMVGSRAAARNWSYCFGVEAWADLRDGLRDQATCEMELAVTDGVATRHYLVKATRTDDHIEGSLQDVTQRTVAVQQLRLMADHDPLTGILNRRGLEIAFSRLSRATVGLAYVDLDRFKLINDLYGHAAGDVILIKLCRQIEGILAGSDVHFGRIGGDEFVVIFNSPDIAGAERQCRNIIDSVFAKPFQMEAKAFTVNVSIGLIEVVAGTRLTDAISAADRACRSAKDGGPNGLVTYLRNAPVFVERAEELRIIKQLGTSDVPAGLLLYGQPIMSLKAPLESLNFEFLLRMQDADSGAVASAYPIIKTAEMSGRISVIDRWVFLNALEWLEAHHETLSRTRVANVNLSGASLNDMRFVEDIYAMLAQHPNAALRLCIEITESVALTDIDNSLRFVHRVQNYGTRIALDDFGAGYTSFSYMRQLPADAVKIDGQFVLGATRHPANMAIVAAISDLARNFGMQSIAEWAEDLATVEAMVEAGIDHLQGFVIARPQPLENILTATSPADFIKDPEVLAYVRRLGRGNELFGFPGRDLRGLH
ncbi:MAG: EAL domain-containing protein [Rhodocyclaceae bacterium]|nr:EAL domain-containing protein [Rhodocyclaceae bacterium]